MVRNTYSVCSPSPTLTFMLLGVKKTVVATEEIGKDLGELKHLLESQNANENQLRENFQEWLFRTQFEAVSSHVWKGAEHPLDPVKPHFPTPLRLHDIDAQPVQGSVLYYFTPWPQDRTEPSPLYYAALCGLHDVAGSLISAYPHYVNARGGYYVTPLVAALAGKYFQLAELLYQHGAAVDARGFEGRTPLWAVSRKEDREVLQWLLNHGADTSVPETSYEMTPLHSAAWYGEVEAARILLEHNADIEIPDIHGWTSLHEASEGGQPNVVRLLLSHGANINARDKGGSTPLHLASHRSRYSPSREGKLAVARVLLRHGADIEAKDRIGRTPFQAVDEDHEDMIELLSEHISTDK
jgi:ankyrin repeat protein